MSRFHVASLTLACLGLQTACTDHEAAPGRACRTFRTTLVVKDRMSQAANVFNPNEAITFDLEIANTTNAPATLTAASSCTAVVFEVFDTAKKRLWGSADGIACFAMLQPRTYSPLEIVNESSTWNQEDSQGVPVPTGEYRVTANVGQYASDFRGQMVDCQAPLSKAATFTIH